jgi:hypothetical protein
MGPHTVHMIQSWHKIDSSSRHKEAIASRLPFLHGGFLETIERMTGTKPSKSPGEDALKQVDAGPKENVGSEPSILRNQVLGMCASHS